MRLRYCLSVLVVAVLTACAHDLSRVSPARLTEMLPAPVSLEIQCAEIVRLQDELGSLAVRGERGSTESLVCVFANARPARLPLGFVQRVLALQAEIDRSLQHYVEGGGRVSCERPIVTCRQGIRIEELSFVGLPRHVDVQRGTRCYLADATYPGGRRPIDPYLTLEYRLGEANDLVVGEYVIERYPLTPLPPVPGPTPLPLVCDPSGIWCRVVESH